jgi:hypothetical protein
MDTAVALVETYLRLNGYFTVTEFPILKADRFGGVHSATDIDVLACRFANPVGMTGVGRGEKAVNWIDPALALGADTVDMIIGEVKEGRPRLNDAIQNQSVIAAALVRFGCCDEPQALSIASALLKHGSATTQCGHRVRMVAFGTGPAYGRDHCKVITLEHIRVFLQAFIRENWDVLSHAQFKDEVLGLLVLLEKCDSVDAAAAEIDFQSRHLNH